MKSYKPIAVCAVLCSVALVSCETNRVNERPIGSVSRPAFPSAGASLPQTSGRSLLDDIQGGTTGNNQGNLDGISDPAQQNNSGTISKLLDGVGVASSPAGAYTANNNPLNPSPITPPQPPAQASLQPAKENIPTAWAIPGDPTVVRSPYDSTKKIRIVDRNGVPFRSGTICRDTNFPNEVRKFRVP